MGSNRRRSYEKLSLDLSLFVHECIELQSSLQTEDEDSIAVDRAASPESDDTECDNPFLITLFKGKGLKEKDVDWLDLTNADLLISPIFNYGFKPLVHRRNK